MVERKKVLCTGCAGFVGSHLIEYLLKQDVDIYGLDKFYANKDNISHLLNKFFYIDVDLTDHIAVYKALKKIKPDIIFHLAANSFVPNSWISPQETLNVNIISELNILESIRELNINPIMTIAGSSEEYGLVLSHEVPIKETNQLRPLSPYAVSKVAQDKLGLQYAHSYGLNIIVTRAFNHCGPRRGEKFVCSDFAKQIAQIEKGLQPPVIKVGNLSALRDFTDVRDMVKAYWLAVEFHKQTVGRCFNICQGKAYSIKEVLDILLSFSKIKITIEPDESRMRPSDVPVLLGDCTRFKEITKWEPQIDFKTTLYDLLSYWRER